MCAFMTFEKKNRNKSSMQNNEYVVGPALNLERIKSMNDA